MITDTQLMLTANILGVVIFLLVIAYHFVAALPQAKKEQ